MLSQFTKEQKRENLIVEIVLRLPCLQKNRLQKIIYFLQEIYAINCGYNFIFTNNYGVHSWELDNDLSYLEAIDIIKKKWMQNMFDYQIEKTDKTKILIEKRKDFWINYKAKLDNIISEFKNIDIKKLDILSIIIYILKRENLNRNDLISYIQEIRLYLNYNEINEIYNYYINNCKIIY